MKRKLKKRRKQDKTGGQFSTIENLHVLYRALATDQILAIKEHLRYALWRYRKASVTGARLSPDFEFEWETVLNSIVPLLDSKASDVFFNVAAAQIVDLGLIAYSLETWRKYYLVADDLWSLAVDTDPSNLLLSDVRAPFPLTVLHFETPKKVHNLTIRSVVVVDHQGLSSELLDELTEKLTANFLELNPILRLPPSFMTGAIAANLKDFRRNVGYGGFTMIYCCNALSSNSVDFLAKGCGGELDSRIKDALDHLTESREKSAKRILDNYVQGDPAVDEEQLMENQEAFIEMYKSIIAYFAFLKHESVKKSSNSFPGYNHGSPVPSDRDCTLNQLTHVWKGTKTVSELLAEGQRCKASLGYVVRHYRGGHFKMQPYGPRHTLRKLIYVEAYMAGGRPKKDKIESEVVC